MAEVQNKKKGSAKGKKGKDGSPTKRSIFFKPATIILVLLTTLLIGLGMVYLARVQQWFSSPKIESKEARLPLAGSPLQEKKPLPLEEAVVSTPAPVPAPASIPNPVLFEEYENIPGPSSRPRQPVIHPQGAVAAIIIDDLGADLAMMQAFLDLNLNFTAAVLPNVPRARAVAELAHANGREILLHMPMEPRRYPEVDPGEKTLLVDLSSDEVEQRLLGYLLTVPWVVGANNHMGSRFTENSEGMATVLQILKKKELFFVDSLTTSNSVAITEAKKLGVAHAERDLFLDNDLNEKAIRRQIRKLIKFSKEHGSAIGICHPHPETLAALKKEASNFAANGVTLVAVSALLQH